MARASYRRRQSSRRRWVLAAFLVAGVVLVTLDFNSGTRSSTMRKVLLDVVQPVESAVGAVGRPVGRFISGLFRAQTIERENEQLRKENEELRRSDIEADRLRHENGELAALAHLAKPEDVQSLTTRVVGVPSTNGDWSILIAAGTADGVADGNPVITGEGLVGRVIDATSTVSKAVLLNDPQMSVGVADERSDVTGVVTGEGAARLRLELVDANADVKVGDRLVTSGVEGSRFPSGILVGTVASVSNDKAGLVLSGEVNPVVDATRRDFISVLLWTPPTR